MIKGSVFLLNKSSCWRLVSFNSFFVEFINSLVENLTISVFSSLVQFVKNLFKFVLESCCFLLQVFVAKLVLLVLLNQFFLSQNSKILRAPWTIWDTILTDNTADFNSTSFLFFLVMDGELSGLVTFKLSTGLLLQRRGPVYSSIHFRRRSCLGLLLLFLIYFIICIRLVDIIHILFVLGDIAVVSSHASSRFAIITALLLNSLLERSSPLSRWLGVAGLVYLNHLLFLLLHLDDTSSFLNEQHTPICSFRRGNVYSFASISAWNLYDFLIFNNLSYFSISINNLLFCLGFLLFLYYWLFFSMFFWFLRFIVLDLESFLLLSCCSLLFKDLSVLSTWSHPYLSRTFLSYHCFIFRIIITITIIIIDIIVSISIGDDLLRYNSGLGYRLRRGRVSHRLLLVRIINFFVNISYIQLLILCS